MVRLGEDFRLALVFAAKKHTRQRMKGTSRPYVGHLLGVASIVIEAGGTEDEAIAALLHDVVEDQDVTLEQVSALFSPEVAAIVGECSEDKGAGDRPWYIRKEEYLTHLVHASPSALLVTAADKLDNARSILRDYRAVGDEVWDRFNSQSDQLWYYPRVLEELLKRTTEPRQEQFQAVVMDLRGVVDELVALLPGSPHPIPDSYQVIPGRLLAGEYPGAPDSQVAAWKLRRLEQAGVDLILDLTEEGEGLLPYTDRLGDGFTYRRMPIRDVGVPTEGEMTAILDAIDEALAMDSVVYVHCFGGIGRTGTVVGCHLVRHGMTGEAALSRIADLRRGTPDRAQVSPETDEQRSMVLKWGQPAEIGLALKVADPVAAVLPQVAGQLRERAAEAGGLLSLGERRDLEPTMLECLEMMSPGLAQKDRKTEIPSWPTVGRVDAIVFHDEPAMQARFLVELKMCPGEDKIYEGIWDLFKMALAATRDDVEATYLVTGAGAAVWSKSPFADLFDSHVHTVRDLCARRFQSASKRLAWDDLLEGGYDRFPAKVPARIRTTCVARETISLGSDTLELRAVRVDPVDGELMRFEAGWPEGLRPADARRPAPVSA